MYHLANYINQSGCTITKQNESIPKLHWDNTNNKNSTAL